MPKETMNVQIDVNEFVATELKKDLHTTIGEFHDKYPEVSQEDVKNLLVDAVSYGYGICLSRAYNEIENHNCD